MIDNKKESRKASASKAVTTVRLPFGKLKIFNQHDTPPPVLFMEGSCIMEFGYLETRDRAEIIDFRTFQRFLKESKRPAAVRKAEEGFVIAHVKIVDGSGEMLYRFDNKQQDRISVSLVLNSREGSPLGEFSLSVSGYQFLVSFPSTTKIDVKNGDDPMNERRVRLRCLDAASGDDIEISGVRIEKRVGPGSIPLYACSFGDLNSQGKELKVMCWYEVANHKH